MMARLFKPCRPLVKMEGKRVAALEGGRVSEELLPLFQSPVPSPDTPLDELEILALDFETSGFDPCRDSILSAGMVEISRRTLRLSTSEHFYFAAPWSVNARAAVVNHITPETLTDGVSFEQGVGRLMKRMAGKIVVVHGSAIEQGFLRQALGIPQDGFLPVVWLDTLMLERSLSSNRGNTEKDYRLSEIRKKKGLPAYLAHNSLADSIASGELFLVLVREIFAHAQPTLGPLYRRSLSGRP
mgnify:CR=1 FL=1